LNRLNSHYLSKSEFAENFDDFKFEKKQKFKGGKVPPDIIYVALLCKTQLSQGPLLAPTRKLCLQIPSLCSHKMSLGILGER